MPQVTVVMPSNNVETLYILSPGHSGSTLLNLILGSHSQATAVSELTYLPANVAHAELCTCGAPIPQCGLWRDVARRIRSSLGIDFLQNPFELELGFVDAPRGQYRAGQWYRKTWRMRRFAIYASQLTGIALPQLLNRRFHLATQNRLAVYQAVREASGAAVIVDASKGYIPGVALYLQRPATTRLILLTRDGRAVFHSNLKRGFDRAYSLRVWRNYYRFGLPIVGRRVAPAHLLSMRYEDFALDPEKEMRRICAFAGLKYEASMLDISSKQHHVTSGNNMRLASDTKIRLDTRWRTELCESDKAFFEAHAGSLNRRLGYE